MATLAIIKKDLNVSSLEFFPVLGEDKVTVTEWHKARTMHGESVLIHDELLTKLKADPSSPHLFLKRKEYKQTETHEEFHVFILCEGSKESSGAL